MNVTPLENLEVFEEMLTNWWEKSRGKVSSGILLKKKKNGFPGLPFKKNVRITGIPKEPFTVLYGNIFLYHLKLNLRESSFQKQIKICLNCFSLMVHCELSIY